MCMGVSNAACTMHMHTCMHMIYGAGLGSGL